MKIPVSVYQTLKRFLFVLLFFLNSHFNLIAQCDETFRMSIGGRSQDIIIDIIELSNGEKILGGQTKSAGAGNWDIFLTRMRNDGSIVWSKTYGGAGDEELRRLRVGPNDQILITGQTKSGGNAKGDLIAMDIDKDGGIIWSTTLGENAGYSLGLDIISTTDNGFVVCGSKYATDASSDWLIAKLDLAGNLIWNQRLSFSINEDAFSLLQIQDTILVCGDSQNPSQYSAIITRLSLSTGEVFDSRAFTMDNRGIFSPKLRSFNNHFLISTHIIDGSSYAQMQEGFLELDASFNIVASLKIPVLPIANFYYTGLSPTKDGGYLLTGSGINNNQGYLYKFDKNLTLISAHNFTSPSSFLIYSVIESDDSTIWVVGSENNHGLIMKLNSSNEFDYCPNYPISLNTQNVVSEKAAFNWNSTTQYNFSSGPVSILSSDFDLLQDTLCMSPKCPKIELSGLSEVCSLSDTIYYTLSNANNCLGEIRWEFPANLNAILVNDTLARITFSEDGIFSFKVYKNNTCSLSSDSMNVTVASSPSILELGNDTTFCDHQSILLDAGPGYAAYVWQDNSSSQVLSVSSSGSYAVTATNYCGVKFSDAIDIVFRQRGDLAVWPSDTSFCLSVPIQLSAKGGDYYRWSPAVSLDDPDVPNPIANPVGSTIYTVNIIDSFCKIDTNLEVAIDIIPPPSISLSKSNDVDCSNGFSKLMAIGGRSYKWSPASSLDDPEISSPIASPTETTTYLVTAYNSLGCSSTDSITVKFSKSGDPSIYIPSAFTPNGDGRNDVFKILTSSQVKLSDFSIYNRWGQRIFTTKDSSRGWDGTFNGIMQEGGVFIWLLRASTPCEGEILKKGTITLIR